MKKTEERVKMQLSKKVCDIPEALSVYMNNVVYEMQRRGEKITVLSLGEAFFDIPIFPIDPNDFKRGCHYTDSRGIPELRKRITDYYLDRYGAGINPQDEILISAGSKPLIYMAFQAVLNPGDEVLIFEPAWLSYQEEIRLANGVPKFIPYDSPIEEIENYITDKTRIVVINNPNNPGGIIYSKEEMEYIYSICRPKGIYVFSDEAYSDFLVDQTFTSLINVAPDKDGIIVVNSLSKNLGISGWRIGYVISSPEVIFQILKLNQHLITCPTSLVSFYLARHFNDLIKITIPQAKAVTKRRAEIAAFIDEIGLESLAGSATFYLFVNIGDYRYSSLDLALHLLTRYKIAVVPGSAYGDSTERFIRIGVGTESFDEMKRALRIIKRVIDENEYDEDDVDRKLTTLGKKRFQTTTR